VFFCGGNNPLKYIPMMFPVVPHRFFFDIDLSGCPSPLWYIKETFAQNPPFLPIKYSWVFAAHIFVVTCTHCGEFLQTFIYLHVCSPFVNHFFMFCLPEVMKMVK
jgi:hypothetical protein